MTWEFTFSAVDCSASPRLVDRTERGDEVPVDTGRRRFSVRQAASQTRGAVRYPRGGFSERLRR